MNPQHLRSALHANDEMNASIEKVGASTQELDENMHAIEKLNHEVEQLLRNITSIAQQTRLLALNASIEADKAGHAGLRFKVVANEVKTLSLRCSETAESTGKLLHEVSGKSTKGLNASIRVKKDFGEIILHQQELAMALQSIQSGGDIQDDTAANIASGETSIRPPVVTSKTGSQRFAFDPATMTTGVESVDTEHRKLIDMVNQLDDACARGAGKQEVEKMLDFLSDYVVKHFSSEESHMHRLGCSSEEQNKKAHKALLDKYTEWRNAYNTKGASLSMVGELSAILKQWLVGHICKIDTCLRTCVEGKTSSSTPSNRFAFDPATMATGVESVDSEHQKLIEMVNQLDDACARGAGKQEVSKMLDFLSEYVVQHFTGEEAHMERLHCPTAKQNEQAHQDLLTKYSAWRKNFDAKGASISMVAELSATLKQWLVGHICKVDVCMRDCVN